jgi:hypothetical protein
VSGPPFLGQKNQMSRDEAIECYILVRLLAEDIKRLSFLVEGLYRGTIQVPNGAPFTRDDLKDTARTAFFGWLAKLTDQDDRAIYVFDPLLVLFPGRRSQIIKVQSECEECHSVLQQFRNNVAFHSRSKLVAHIEARRALVKPEDTFLNLESARKDFLRLMDELISDELSAIPELAGTLARLDASHDVALAKILLKKSA